MQRPGPLNCQSPVRILLNRRGPRARGLISLSAALVLTFAPHTAFTQHPAPTVTQVSPGVWLFQTARYGDAGLDGNAVAVVGRDAVLVFDANGTPAAAAAVIAEIRRITPKPVKHLVLSHWHWDHWYGAEAYTAAFPGIEVIAHSRAAKLMDGPVQEFNRPFFTEQFPSHLKGLEASFATVAGNPAADSAARAISQHITADKWFLDQKQNVRFVKPTRVYEDSLIIDLGGRSVHVVNHGRAITPGDSHLWLPDARTVVAGDLLINPMTYGLFAYPSEWLATLERMDARAATTIIPGHGTPMTDGVRLRATIALLRREIALVRGLKASGKTAKEAQAAVLADAEVLALRDQLAPATEPGRGAFALYLVEWIVPRIYQELDGTLDNAIPRAP